MLKMFLIFQQTCNTYIELLFHSMVQFNDVLFKVYDGRVLCIVFSSYSNNRGSNTEGSIVPTYFFFCKVLVTNHRI